MARVRASAELRSIEARRRLRARMEPYWLRVERGLFLGYRKARNASSWIARRYQSQSQSYAEEAIGLADDSIAADGEQVLSFSQAQRRLLQDFHLAARRSNGELFTVSDAVDEYLEWLRMHRKSGADAAFRLRAYVGSLAEKPLGSLTTSDFEAWLKWAMTRKRRYRGRLRKAAASINVQEPQLDDPVDRARRRKSTINRVIAALKACLNHAFEAGHVTSRDAWARLKKFRGVDSARLRWLTIDEASRLQAAVRPDLRPMVQAGLLTGCREGELLCAQVRDYDARSATLLIADSKSGKSRRVPLTDSGVALFNAICADRNPNALLFPRADGTPWYSVAIGRCIHAACKLAEIEPPATFYTLRHTYASHLVQQGTPLLIVAEVMGHRDTRMVEKHYAHLSPSHVATAIRKNLPQFGIGAPNEEFP